MKKRLFLLAALLAVAVSCGEDGPVEEPESPAPVLVSTSPSNGATGVEGYSLSAVFSFDQNIKCSLAAQEGITIDGKASIKSVTPYGRDLTVEVSGLQQKTTYTLTLPEGTVQGFRNNQKGSAPITLTFTTKETLVPAPDGWESAASAAHNMGTGWNLGNTLEANSGDLKNMWIEAWTGRTTSDYETAWGQPVATRELIHMFKEEGFNTIRVPVTWYPHMGKITISIQKVDGSDKGVWDPATWTGYDVDPVWMARVKQVVDYVIDEGMYCVLNVHHDTGDASTAWLRADAQAYATYKERYSELWRQIATTFADYDHHLLFESFNEMLDAKGTWNRSSSESHEVINKWNADFVSTVRATGGNNAHRNLILNTYAASTDAQALKDFRLPADSAEKHLLAEVHSYAPYLFAFDQSTYTPKKTFDESCDKEVRGIIDGINTYLVSKGIPCVLGEYGCTGTRDVAERAKQAACYVSAAAKYDIACLYWMSLSDQDDRKVPKWTTPEIKNAILNAFNESRK